MSILAMTVCTAEYSINCISRGDVSIRKQQNHVDSFVNLPTSWRNWQGMTIFN